MHKRKNVQKKVKNQSIHHALLGGGKACDGQDDVSVDDRASEEAIVIAVTWDEKDVRKDNADH